MVGFTLATKQKSFFRIFGGRGLFCLKWGKIVGAKGLLFFRNALVANMNMYVFVRLDGWFFAGFKSCSTAFLLNIV